MAQSKREYLASLTPPLAKPPPSRGRFSRAAEAELVRARAGGMVFSDDESKPRVTEDTPAPVPYVPPKVKSKPVVRDIKRVTGFTEEGYEVASDLCMACHEHVSRCDCPKGIKASSIVVRWSEESAPYGAPIDQPVPV